MKRFVSFWGWLLLLLPTLIFYFGFGLNQFCIMHNGYQMPVRMADCAQNIVQTDPQTGNTSSDPVHICESTRSRYMVLADIFVTDGGVMSLGDIVMDVGDGLTWPALAIWAAIGIECLFRKRYFAFGSYAGERV